MMVELHTSHLSPRHVMLCKVCHRIVARIGTAPGSWEGPEPQLFGYPTRADTWRGAHHINDPSLVSSGKQGCYICNPLLDAFPRQERDRAPFARTFYEIRPDGYRRWIVRFAIELPQRRFPDETRAQVIECYGVFKILPKNVLSAAPLKLRLTDHTSSDSCKSQVQRWLSKCARIHSACNDDWRTTTQYSIRLLNVSDTYVRLEEFAAGSCHEKYVTLSHCWDNTLKTSISQLTTSNLHYLRSGFAESRLPKKFQNAVEVARWMGVKYLWIDALCIVQDSVDDWRSQSSAMGDIYGGSHCNIAAMNRPGEDGFLRQRSLEVIEPFSIRDPEHSSCSTTHVIGFDDFWCNSLLSSPLHNRAWVLQERQLSPRTIHFGEQIFWECREHKACEVYPDGIPEEFSNRRTKVWRQGEQVFDPKTKVPCERSQQPPLDTMWVHLPSPQPEAPSFPQREAYEYWSSTVERYMECELSYASDKLMAIQGLANKVHDTTGERYLAGLWDSPDLAHSLLWYTPARQQGNGHPSVKYPPLGMKGNRAPSWSWASLDGKIVWNWPAQRCQLLLEVEQTVAHIPSEIVPGVADSIEMRVRGSLLAVRLQIMNSDENGRPDEDGSYAVLPWQAPLAEEHFDMINEALSRSEPTIFLDEALAPSRAIDVYLLPVVSGWRGRLAYPAAEVAGLILRRHQLNTNSVYERIGVFCFDKIPGDEDEDDPGGDDGSLQAAFEHAGTEHVTLI